MKFISAFVLFVLAAGQAAAQQQIGTGRVHDEMRYQETNTANGREYVAIQAPASVAASFHLTWPGAVPAGGTKCLEVDTSGVLIYAAAACGAGGGGYDTIESNGTPLTQRNIINFDTTMSAADDSGSPETDVGINLGKQNIWTNEQNQQFAGGVFPIFESTDGGSVHGILRTDSAGRRWLGQNNASAMQSGITFGDSSVVNLLDSAFVPMFLVTAGTVRIYGPIQTSLGAGLLESISGSSILLSDTGSNTIWLFDDAFPVFRFEGFGTPNQFVIDDGLINFDNIGTAKVAIDINSGLLGTLLGGKVNIIGGGGHTSALRLKAAAGGGGALIMDAQDSAAVSGFYVDSDARPASFLDPTSGDHLVRKSWVDAGFLSLGTPEQTVTTVKNFSGGLRAQTINDLVGTPGITISATDGTAVADVFITAEDDVVITATGRLTLTGSEAGGFGGIDIQNDVDARGQDINALKFLAVIDGSTAGRVEWQGTESGCGISLTSLSGTTSGDDADAGGCGSWRIYIDADANETTRTFEVRANGGSVGGSTLAFSVEEDGDVNIGQDLTISAGNTFNMGTADFTEVSGGIQFNGGTTGDGFLMTASGGIELSGNGSGFGDLETNGSDILLESGSQLVGSSGSETTFNVGAVLALPTKGTDINCTTDTNSSSNGVLVQTTAKELQICISGTAYKVALVTPL